MIPGRLSQATEKAISQGILSHCMIPGRLSQATEKAISEGILSHCMIPDRLSQATEKATGLGILKVGSCPNDNNFVEILYGPFLCSI